MEKTVNITIKLPEGYSGAEYDEETHNLRFIKDEYPVLNFADALASKEGQTVYYINGNSYVLDYTMKRSSDLVDINTYANTICSYDEAVAFRALIKLRFMRDVCVGDWKPSDNQIVYYISMSNFEVYRICKNICSELFVFPTKESAKEFVERNKELFDSVKVLFG